MHMVEQSDRNLPVRAGGHDSRVTSVQFRDDDIPKETTLRDILYTLGKRMLTILSFLLIGLLLAALYLIVTRPTYVSNATIRIEKEQPKIIENGVVKEPAVGGGEKDPFYPTVYQELKSRTLANDVIRKLSLEESLKDSSLSQTGEYYKDKVKAFVYQYFPSNESAGEVDEFYLTNQFLENLQIQPIDGTRLVDVSYRAHTPEEAADAVNTLIESFVESRVNSDNETDEYAKRILMAEMNDARKKLRRAEKKLANYTKKAGILAIDEGQKTRLTRLSEIQDALSKAQRARITAENNFRQMQNTGNISASLDNGVIGAMKQRLVGLETTYQEKLKVFKPAYPEMVGLRQQIDVLKKEINTEKGAVLDGTRAEYEGSLQLETRLKKELANYEKKLADLQDKSVDYNTLKREVETDRKLYETLLSRMGEVSVATKAINSNVHIVDPAIPNVKAVTPNKGTVLGLGALSGLLFGLAFGFLRESLDDGDVSHNEKIQQDTGMSVLGTIPIADRVIRKYLPTVVVDAPHSPVSEAYRIAAANVRLAMQRKHPSIVLLVTSAHPSEGKSVASTNLACTYAQMGQKVLLIDCDLRMPTVHTKLGLSNQVGISDYISEDIGLIHITQAVKAVKNLYVITAGQDNTHPAEVLGNKKMAMFLDHAKKHFDMIILDSPPVHGFADTLVLNSLADSTLLVSPEKTADKDKLNPIIDQLNEYSHKLIGIMKLSAQNDVMKRNYYQNYYHKGRKESITRSGKRTSVAKDSYGKPV